LIFNRSKRAVQANISKYFYVRRTGSTCLQINPLNQLHIFYGFHERYIFALNNSEVHGILPILLKKSLDHGFIAIYPLLLLKNYPNKELYISEFYKRFDFYKDVKLKDKGLSHFVKLYLIVRMPKLYSFLYRYYHKFKN